jgi:D-inositol-3-phosphate glycosyltransferase
VRVLLVSANFRPRVGGIERFTEVLAAGLAQRGHDVVVLCCRYGDAPGREELDGFLVERIPASYALARRLNVPYPLPSLVPLFRLLRRRVPRADVVHVQDVLYASSLPSLVVAASAGTPSVLTQHVAFVPQGSPVLDAVEHVALATVGRCSRLATVVATLNPEVATWVRRQWGIDDVRVLPVGVGQPHVAADRAGLRRTFGLPPHRFVALFVGRDVPKKGLDIFLAAGDPAYDLVAVTDREDAAEGSTVLPFMTPERLSELVACADAFVLPSEGEGLPLSLQEALMAGVAVVTTRQPGYEHFFAPSDVLYVDRRPQAVRAALRRLSGDATLRRGYAERGRAVAERHFGLDRFVGAYEQLYETARERVRRPG